MEAGVVIMSIFRRNESRATSIAFEIGAWALAIFTIAAAIHLGRHFLIFVANLFGGAL